MDCVLVPEPQKDVAWDGTQFFDLWDDDEDDEVPATGPDSSGQEMKFTSTPAAQLQVCDLAGDGQSLLTEVPHVCPTG
jgi:hypothetical protein